MGFVAKLACFFFFLAIKCVVRKQPSKFKCVCVRELVISIYFFKKYSNINDYSGQLLI